MVNEMRVENSLHKQETVVVLMFASTLFLRIFDSTTMTLLDTLVKEFSISKTADDQNNDYRQHTCTVQY